MSGPGAASSGGEESLHAAAPRNFLFLQGVASPFFWRLARALRRRGHRVTQVRFNGGDALFSLGLPGCHFRETSARLPAFAERMLERHAVTDVVAFGDCRPVHVPVLEHARARGLRLHLFEEGYLRPGWITIEGSGINGHSSLPREAAAYLQAAEGDRAPATLPAPAEGLGRRAVYDIAYHLANFSVSWLYPGYRNHRLYRAYQEYGGWLRRHAGAPWRARRWRRLRARLDRDEPTYFLLPLQLDGDTQITQHSRYDWVSEVIDEVVRSFALHAPPGCWLLLKRHPLDTGLVDHAAQVEALRRRYGLGERVVFFEGGDLAALVRGAAGVVMVNSTVGTLTLELGRPLMALGEAVYRVPGLTHAGTLASFWTEAEPPDRALFTRFRNVVIARTQIRGNYYTPAGIACALPACIERLERHA